MLLFNSRTIGIEKGSIVPIIAGLRLSGKARGLQVGLLDLQTHGIDEQSIDPQHFSVLRIRKEVWGNGSFIGGIATNRISTSGDSFNNQTLGVDAVKRFKDNKWMLGANLATTNDRAFGDFFDQSLMANVVISRTVSVGYNLNSSFEYVEKNCRSASEHVAPFKFAVNGFMCLVDRTIFMLGRICNPVEIQARRFFAFPHIVCRN